MTAQNTTTPGARPSDAALEWVRRLVEVDTTSRDSNLPLLAEATELLDRLGIAYTTLPNEDGTKANLLATIPAADGSTGGGVILSGHTDVVPVDGQDWSSDPFELVEREGRLYGRGTSDMKSFIAVVLSRVEELAARSLSEPVHLALSYDEEVGCVGARSLVEAFAERGELPRACIVGEPTSMRVVRGHKSMNVLRADFRGKAIHSSRTTEGVNAIEHAATFVRFVRDLAEGFIQDGPFDRAYDFEHTTVSVNHVEGGTAVNIVPADCSVTFEYRTIAEDDPAEIRAALQGELDRIQEEMRRVSPEASIELTVLAESPGLETAADAELIGFATDCGAEPADAKVAYGTEAGLFHRAGIPAVVCGPGDIAQAHTPDEFIELDQIARCEAFLDAVIDRLSA
ncbi:acetylornithine deacetylase [Rothia sp. AR01]|uniref:Acetylornithine deacetylase n=1 Tax=Rothia santali TaxID=2949643 RepID=A0A9X2HH66_9MICC|nr:acetylornithine deacetylase [Rothia santali]MCP3427279.1 acetylornithine deacetylase [Rothia santali]